MILDSSKRTLSHPVKKGKGYLRTFSKSDLGLTKGVVGLKQKMDIEIGVF